MKFSKGQLRVLTICQANPKGIGRKELAAAAEVSITNLNLRFVLPLVEAGLLTKETIDGDLTYIITKTGKRFQFQKPEPKAKAKPKAKPKAAGMEEILHEIAPKKKAKAKAKPKAKAAKKAKIEMVELKPAEYEKRVSIDDAITQLTVYIEALAYGHQKWRAYGFSSVTEMKGHIYGLINIIIRKTARGNG